MNEFVVGVLEIYKKEYNNLGFIPKKRIYEYYDGIGGHFYRNDNGFILIGSLKSKITPIYAVYIYPNKRNGSTDKVKELINMLPPKAYRVRCHFGKTFWIRMGLKEIRVENKNKRNRDITVLEGIF